MNTTKRKGWPINIFEAIIGGELQFVINYEYEAKLMAVLNEMRQKSEKNRNRVAILLRYYRYGMTMEEIGDELGITKAAVSKNISETMRKLRAKRIRDRIMPGILTIAEIDEYYRKKMAELDEREARLDARQRKLNEKEGILDIEDMGLSVRAFDLLKRAGLNTSKDIIECIETDNDRLKRVIKQIPYDDIVTRLNELFGTNYSLYEED